MHDPLCYVAMNGGNCCPWMPSCDCQCMCEYIDEIRQDSYNKAADLVVEYFNRFPSLAKVHVDWLNNALRSGGRDE